jgi:hypothetical protein
MMANGLGGPSQTPNPEQHRQSPETTAWQEIPAFADLRLSMELLFGTEAGGYRNINI